MRQIYIVILVYVDSDENMVFVAELLWFWFVNRQIVWVYVSGISVVTSTLRVQD